MQKDNVFFKDFSSGFIVAGLAFTVFFATALFFELAIGSIFNVEPSQGRISLAIGFFMAVGVGFFIFSKKAPHGAFLLNINFFNCLRNSN